MPCVYAILYTTSNIVIYILHNEKGHIKRMIIKIFKISTAEMWMLKNKKSLMLFVEKETGMFVSDKLNIEQLVKYLPVENYYWVK